MKWRFIILFTIFTGALLILVFSLFLPRIENVLSYNACNTPMPYKIGSIDPRFGLQYGDVQQEIQQATNIWSTAYGKMLFVYSPNAHLTVSFVFDQRQALNGQIQQLSSNLNQTNLTLKQKISDFKEQEAAYEQKVVAFHTLVNTYNSRGGVSPEVFKSLIQQQNDLNSEAQTLNATAGQLNLSANNYNANITNLNQDINQLNIVLSQKPEEGLYNSVDDSITIYLTNSRAELIHTLAHEFGHSLGMIHVEGNTSIMYPYTSSSLVVTANDMKQLMYVCRQQSLIIHELVIIDEWVFAYIQNIQQSFVK